LRIIEDIDSAIQLQQQEQAEKDSNSSNSSSGLSGYYICDTRVKSELCVPIVNLQTGQVVGIIDAESPQSNFFSFTSATGIINVAHIVKACYQLSQHCTELLSE